MTLPKAAIDCGTNSIRLLVCTEDSPGKLTDLVRHMEVVRLGQGVDVHGKFSEESLERTFAACTDYAHILDEYNVNADNISFVATSATRDASNKNVFIQGVYDILGVKPEVISGSREAELSFIGAASSLSNNVAPEQKSHTNDKALIIDLGGGSTEFVIGEYKPPHTHSLRPTAHLDGAISMDMGCVRMTERYDLSDQPDTQKIASAIEDIDNKIAQADAAVNFSQAQSAVGVAGTITTVTAAALDLPRYDRDLIDGTALSLETIISTSDKLLGMSLAERQELGFMHPGRTDVVAAGSLIYSRIALYLHNHSSLTKIITSEHDILDGIALSITA